MAPRFAVYRAVCGIKKIPAGRCGPVKQDRAAGLLFSCPSTQIAKQPVKL